MFRGRSPRRIGRVGSGDVFALVLALEAGDMTLKFFGVGPAAEVPTQHAIRAQCGLAAGPQRDQEARDDGF